MLKGQDILRNGQGPIDLSIPVSDLPGDLAFPQDTQLDIFRFNDYIAMFRHQDTPMKLEELVKIITRISQQLFNLNAIGNAFSPLTINIGTTPTQILPPNKDPRGYLFLNPSQTVTGITASTTLFPDLIRVAGVYTSIAVNVQTFGTSAFFLNIVTAPATIRVDLQTQDPLTGNWATAQADIFAGANSVGNHYANTGAIGTDNTLRLVMTTTGTSEESISLFSKPALSGTVAPPTVALGNANVTVAVGYPILGGQEKKFILLDNTPLFGVGLAATTLKVFQLQ